MTTKRLQSPVGPGSDHGLPVPALVMDQNLGYWMRLVLECSDEQADKLGFDDFAGAWMAVVDTGGAQGGYWGLGAY